MKNKLSLDEFQGAALSEFLTIDELIRINGGYDPGSTMSYDCVFNVFDYFDGSAHDSTYYDFSTHYNLGYNAEQEGGVRTSDISTIGGFGGLTVTEFNGSLTLDSNGQSNGNGVMMTFDAGGSGDHAVGVTGYVENSDGTISIEYYAPTTGEYNTRVSEDAYYYEVANNN